MGLFAKPIAAPQFGGIPLKKVPAVLLTECYNDLRTIAATGPGYDPEWQQKMD